jgi:hypothetical protein
MRCEEKWRSGCGVRSEEKRRERSGGENDLGLGLESGEAMRRILYSLISS